MNQAPVSSAAAYVAQGEKLLQWVRQGHAAHEALQGPHFPIDVHHAPHDIRNPSLLVRRAAGYCETTLSHRGQSLPDKPKKRSDAVEKVNRSFARVDRRRRYAGLGVPALHVTTDVANLPGGPSSPHVGITTPQHATPVGSTPIGADASLAPSGAPLRREDGTLASAMKRPHAATRSSTGASTTPPRAPRRCSLDSAQSIGGDNGECGEAAGAGGAFGGMLQAIREVQRRSSLGRPDALPSTSAASAKGALAGVGGGGGGGGGGKMLRALSSKSIGGTVNTLVVALKLKGRFRALRSSKVARSMGLAKAPEGPAKRKQLNAQAAALAKRAAAAAAGEGDAPVAGTVAAALSAEKARELHRRIVAGSTRGGPTLLQFAPSPLVQVCYGSVIGLESLDGWWLGVHPVTGAVSVREPQPGWFARGAMPFEPSWDAAQGKPVPAPRYLFRVLDLRDPLANGPLRIGDPLWLQVAEGNGVEGWRAGSVLAPCQMGATPLDGSAVDIEGHPVAASAEGLQTSAAGEALGSSPAIGGGTPVCPSQRESASDALFGLPRPAVRRHSLSGGGEEASGSNASSAPSVGPSSSVASAGEGKPPHAMRRQQARLLASREGLPSSLDGAGGRDQQRGRGRADSKGGGALVRPSSRASRLPRSASRARCGAAGPPPVGSAAPRRSGAGGTSTGSCNAASADNSTGVHQTETTAAFLARQHREAAQASRLNPLDLQGVGFGVPRPLRAHVPTPGSAADFVLGPRTHHNPKGEYRQDAPGYEALSLRANGRPLVLGRWALRVARKEVLPDGMVLGGLGIEAFAGPAAYHAAVAVHAKRGPGPQAPAADAPTPAAEGSAAASGAGGGGAPLFDSALACELVPRKPASLVDVDTRIAGADRTQSVLLRKIARGAKQREKEIRAGESANGSGAAGEDAPSSPHLDAPPQDFVFNFSEVYLEQGWLYLGARPAGTDTPADRPHATVVGSGPGAPKAGDRAPFRGPGSDNGPQPSSTTPGDTHASHCDGADAPTPTAAAATEEGGAMGQADLPASAIAALSAGDPGRAMDSHWRVAQPTDELTGGNRRPTHMQPHAERLSGKFKVDPRAVFRVRLLQTCGSGLDGAAVRDDRLALRAQRQLRDTEKSRLGEEATAKLQNLDDYDRERVAPVATDRTAAGNMARLLRADLQRSTAESDARFFDHEARKAADLGGYFTRRMSLVIEVDEGGGYRSAGLCATDVSSVGRRPSVGSFAAPSSVYSSPTGSLHGSRSCEHVPEYAHSRPRDSSRLSSAARGLFGASAAGGAVLHAGVLQQAATAIEGGALRAVPADSAAPVSLRSAEGARLFGRLTAQADSIALTLGSLESRSKR